MVVFVKTLGIKIVKLAVGELFHSRNSDSA